MYSGFREYGVMLASKFNGGGVIVKGVLVRLLGGGGGGVGGRADVATGSPDWLVGGCCTRWWAWWWAVGTSFSCNLYPPVTQPQHAITRKTYGKYMLYWIHEDLQGIQVVSEYSGDTCYRHL